MGCRKPHDEIKVTLHAPIHCAALNRARGSALAFGVGLALAGTINCGLAALSLSFFVAAGLPGFGLSDLGSDVGDV